LGKSNGEKKERLRFLPPREEGGGGGIDRANVCQEKKEEEKMKTKKGGGCNQIFSRSQRQEKKLGTSAMRLLKKGKEKGRTRYKVAEGKRKSEEKRGQD